MTIKVYLLDDHEVVRLGLRQLLESESDIEVAGEASFCDDEALFTAIMAGAAGYLLKQVSGTDLIGAVRRLAAGESLLDPAMTTAVLDRLRNPADGDDDPRYKSLTDQERKILDLVAEGKTNRLIAETMFLAEKTVKNYVSGLLRKLGMERRTEAAVYAVERAKRRPPR
ncbi:MAG: hypothetical protein QOF10_1117 [Kribbellaceae bacterium]|jgi:DNA-binding NarL/FixJ family response regulator|nr:hypothetical protein [Kribbellaceae bacterium]